MSDLGRIHAALRQGRVADAQAWIQPLLKTAPRDPEVHRAAAAIAQLSGRMDDALRSIRTAVSLAPDSAVLQVALGQALASTGQAAAATACFRQATTLQPTLVDAWYLLGMQAANANALDDARVAFERALALAPGQPALLQALAETEYLLELREQALPRFEQLVASMPDQTGFRLRLAQCRRFCREHALALSGLHAALERFPDDAALWFELGWLHEDLGDAVQAGEAYSRAHALAPTWADPVACAIALARGSATEALLSTAQGMLSAAHPPQTAFLHHVLGKDADLRGDFATAATHWAEANRLRRQMDGAFDRCAHSARIDAAIAATSPTFPWPVEEAVCDDPRPVFVVGMVRSGTTLVEQVIAAHPDAHGCGELFTIMQAAEALAKTPQSPDHGGLRQIADAWLRTATRHAPAGARCLVDKMPYNDRHLDLIARLFPKARVIWCRRDPRDLALSIYSESFAPWATYATDLDDIRFVIDEQERLMRHWQAVLPLPILDLRYEDMVADSERQFRRLIAFVGLDWDARCLQFHAQGRAIQTHSRWQARQPVNNRSVGRWRHYPQWFAAGP